MAYRERLALANLIFSLFGLAGFGAVTWGGDAAAGLAAPLFLCVTIFVIAMTVLSIVYGGGEDERDVQIRLKAGWIASMILAIGVGMLWGNAGGVDILRGEFGSIPAGPLVCLVFASHAVHSGIQLYHYRRGA